MTIFYSTIFCWKNHVAKALKPLKFAYQLSLSCGDTEWATLCANSYLLCQLAITPIPTLVKNTRLFRDTMSFYGQDTNLMYSQPTMYILLSHSGQTDGDFGALRKEIFNGEDIDTLAGSNKMLFLWSCYARMEVSYIFGKYDEAYVYSQRCRQLANYPAGQGDVSYATFFFCLSALARARKSQYKWRHFKRVAQGIKRMKYWATHAPLNFLGKMFLLEAELAWVKGDRASAHPKFESAISLTREGGFYMLTALAYERTGKFFLESENTDAAAPYFENALSMYGEWGAFAKRDHLMAEIDGTTTARSDYMTTSLGGNTFGG
jgi:tetratricopeptide (TPR) repeat protein